MLTQIVIQVAVTSTVMSVLNIFGVKSLFCNIFLFFCFNVVMWAEMSDWMSGSCEGVLINQPCAVTLLHTVTERDGRSGQSAFVFVQNQHIPWLMSALVSSPKARLVRSVCLFSLVCCHYLFSVTGPKGANCWNFFLTAFTDKFQLASLQPLPVWRIVTPTTWK